MEFSAVEEKWQKRWFDEKAFEPTPDNSKQKFFFTVPFPYVSGALHVGHGRTYTYGDVIARFKRMQGFNLLWPMAFHITGTPVLAVSAKIAANDAATIKLYNEYVAQYEPDASKIPGIVASFKEPWAVVNYFSSKLVADFKTIGFSLDLSRQFTTGDKEYNKFVEWQFHKYKKKGYLKQAAYPILYCTGCKNAAGEDDIQEGDTNPVEVQKFIAFKFKLEGTDEFVVSSTLRPETVFGITNMFVNPSVSYALVEVDGEKWWVSAAAVEKLKLQNHAVNLLREASGAEFVGKKVESPIGVVVPVLPASFVDADNASGFVHSVPAHAPYDYVALEDLKKDKAALAKFPQIVPQLNAIKLISLISCEGFGEFPAKEIAERMKIANLREAPKLDKATTELYRAEFYGGKLNANCGEFAGKTVEQAKDAVSAKLVASKRASYFYETSRNALCRCANKIVAAVISDQWFIDFNSQGWKERSNECLDEMFIFPTNYKKQFQDIFAWLDKRPCARRRGIGTQLPFANEWIVESLSDSTIYMAFYTIIKQIREHKLQPEQLTEEFFDFVFLGDHSAEAVSQKTRIPLPVLESIRAEFNYWYPNDLRHTAIAHITNHLSFYIFAHTAIFSPKHWPRAITLNELLIREGVKMSKSKGNVIILGEVKKRYGADLFRAYMCVSSDFNSVLDFREKEVDTMKRSLNKFVEVIEQLLPLRNTASAAARAKPSNVSLWFLSKFERAIQDSTKAMEEFRLRDYLQKSFLGLLNAWDYFNRRATEEDKRFIADEVAERFVALLAPVIPHTCEELWEKAGKKQFVSLSAWPEAHLERINDSVEKAEDLIVTVLADLRSIKALVSSKFKPSKAKVIIAAKHKAALLRDSIAKVGSPEELAIADEALKKYAAKNFFQFKEEKFDLDEASVLRGALDFLSKEIGLSVTLEEEEKSAEEKKSRALPLKPSIVMA